MRIPTLAAWAALAALAWPAAAEAHRFQHPKALRLGVRGGAMYLTTTLDVNPGPEAGRTRALFDRDADGALSPAERVTLEEALERLAWHFLEVRIDGAPVAWTRRERAGHRLDKPATDDSTLGIALLHEATLTGDEVTLEIRDRDKDARAHVPLVVDLGPGWSVRAASQGEWHPKARQVRGIRLEPERIVRLVLRRAPPAAP